MSVNYLDPQTIVVQGTNSVTDISTIVDESMMRVNIIGLMQALCSVLIIVGLIVGIIYMVKSKKTKGKRILIGAIIIVVPFIVRWILNIVKLNMLLNM